ncbi:MAG: Eco57I restriction-modification methylase domain-containing protein [Candidatus Thorarchaeota archaeon]
MRPNLKEVAWSIISGLHQTLRNSISQTAYKPLEISEATRLAGLTFVMASRQLDEAYFFSKLSYEAERVGISPKHINNLAREVLETFRYQIPENLSSEDLATLLGLIHSIGCYVLPLRYNRGTYQKSLGAYYTPPWLADYIVSLTISPKLEKLAELASNKGLSALKNILALKTLDPACGTGVFLVSAVYAFDRALKKGIDNALEHGISHSELDDAGVLNYKQTINENMVGVDIDSGALEVTDVSLRLLSQTDSEKLGNSALGKTLKRGNSLISLKGLAGTANHKGFFEDPYSRFPFEWCDEFSNIMGDGGFDFIVMNPPYERLKANLSEFLRDRLLTGEREIHMDNYSRHKERMNEDILYFRNSGDYVLSSKYTIDIHRLFIERALQLTSEGSRIGFIVPSTILGDLSSYPLRKTILEENILLTIDDFPETSRLFDGVTQSVTVMTLERGGHTKSIMARFSLRDITDVNSYKSIHIPADQIERTAGPLLSIPQVDKVGWKLVSKMHKHPTVSELDYLSVHRGELDLTLNRECIMSKPTNFRLIRGSDISRFSFVDRKKGQIEYVDIKRLKYELGKSKRIEHINQHRIAGQQVSNRTQRWRLKFALVPNNVVLANSCNYILDVDSSNNSRGWFLLSILNSELMNWRFNLTNTNNHVSTRELLQLPIAEIESRESLNFSSLLIDEVRKIESKENMPLIEALVFALYGFSTNESKDVLKMRFVPKKESTQILAELRDLIH